MNHHNLELEVKSWHQGALGSSLLAMEKKYLDKILVNITGNYVLKFNLLNNTLSNKCKVLHQVYVAQNLPEDEIASINEKLIQCSFDKLPFLCDSIDVAIVPHILEFTQNPHLILEEIYHALAPNGKIIITAFNPSSLWSVVKYFRYKSVNTYPWNGRFISPRRLKNWLLTLGFSVNSQHTFYFRPPINHLQALKGLSFMEKFGKILCPQLGACYILTAVKTVGALPPLEPKPVTNHVSLRA